MPRFVDNSGSEAIIKLKKFERKTENIYAIVWTDGYSEVEYDGIVFSCGEMTEKEIFEIVRNVRDGNNEVLVGSDGTSISRLTNALYRIETLTKIDDAKGCIRYLPTNIYEEIGDKYFVSDRMTEQLVRLNWKGVKIRNICVQKGLRSLGRKNILAHIRRHTVLLLEAFVRHHITAWKWLVNGGLKRYIDKNLLHCKDSNACIASSVSLGVCMSVLPIWGGQMAVALAIAHVLRLNKIVVTAFTNISLPPFIPFIVIASARLGSLITGQDVMVTTENVSAEKLGNSFLVYALGATILGVCLAAVVWLPTWLLLAIARRKRSTKTNTK